MPEIYITHCCARKSRKKGKIPAIQRYLAGFIKKVYELSKKRKKGFLIFSGKYGFLKSDDKIPYYDKLLKYKDFQKLFKKTDKQFKELKFKKAVFFHTDPETDEHIMPYIDFMKEFARKNGISLVLKKIKNG